MSLRSLQLVLLTCAAAGLVILVSAFPFAARIACLAVVIAAAALTAGERHRPGGGWWLLLAAGAALSVAGLALSEGTETAGGVVALAGAVFVVAACAIGYPLADERSP